MPETWLFLRSFRDLRSVDATEEVSATGILRETAIETLAQMGRHAFSESDPPSNVVLVVWRLGRVLGDHRLVSFRLVASRPAEEQAALLKVASLGRLPDATFRPRQVDFLELPGCPVLYYLRPDFYLLLKTDQRVGDFAWVKQGLATANKERFTRLVCESRTGGRWIVAAHGGGYGKWWSPNYFAVDWEANGARIKASPGVRVQSEEFYRREGFWYTQVARGSLGLRKMWPASLFTNISSGVFCKSVEGGVRSTVLAYLNSRLATYLLRGLSQKIVFSEGYPPLLPWPRELNCSCSVEFAFCLKRLAIQTTDILDSDFMPTGLSGLPLNPNGQLSQDVLLLVDALRHTVEGAIDRQVMNAFALSASMC